MEGILTGTTDDFLHRQLRLNEEDTHNENENDDMDNMDGGDDDAEMMLTLSRAAAKAEKEERKRKREERRNEKMLRRALKIAGADAGSEVGEMSFSGLSGDVEQIDPALREYDNREDQEQVEEPGPSKRPKKSDAALGPVVGARSTSARTKDKAKAKEPTKVVSTSKSSTTAVDQYGRPTNDFARKKNNKKEMDVDELRVKLRGSGAVDAFLSERWMETAELRRLEEAGVLTYKKGRFAAEEEQAIRRNLSHFQRVNHMTDPQLTELIMSKGRKMDHPKFWSEVAAWLPGRPVRFVQKYVKRLYDTRARKGRWSEAEDEALKKAFHETNGSWVKIAESVDRPEEDCRARWRDYHTGGSRDKGHWTKAEENALIDAIKEANTALGKDELSRDAPWEVVSQKLEGKRTTMQCRKKWHEQLLPDILGEKPYSRKKRSSTNATQARVVSEDSSDTGVIEDNELVSTILGEDEQSPAKKKKKPNQRIGAEEKREFILLIEALNPATVSSIDWTLFSAEHYPHIGPENLVRTFKKMIKRVDPTRKLPLPDVLDLLKNDANTVKARKTPLTVSEDTDEEAEMEEGTA